MSQTTKNAIGLCVDNSINSSVYTCIITDSQGCQDTVSHELTQPEELIVDASVVDEVLCYGDNNGRLTASVVGGNGGNEFYWNNSTSWSVTANNPSLESGSYVVIARDNKGCVDTTEIFLSQPSQMTLSTTTKNILCFGESTGQISSIVSGGTPFPGIPPTYQYLWSPTNQTTNTASNLSVGTYTVTVKDQNNCSLSSSPISITQPSNPLSISVDSTDETCLLNNGTATANINGGTVPYLYTWYNSSGAILNDISSSISNLSPGKYTVQVEDKNGCLIDGLTQINGVRNIFVPGNLDQIDTTICLGKNLVVDVEEKPGYTYLWSTGSTSSDIVLQPTTEGMHNYVLNVTEPGCNPYELEVNIYVDQINSQLTSNRELAFRSDDVISIDKAVHILSVVNDESFDIYSNSNFGVTHNWNWLQSSSTNNAITVNNIDKNFWIYLQLDSSGCIGNDSIYVILSVIPFDAISPNGDMKNDTWNILGITSSRYSQATIKIFNRWGDEVFQTKGGSQYVAWDGTKDGNELPIGTYYYIIDLANEDEPLTGPITIIR